MSFGVWWSTQPFWSIRNCSYDELWWKQSQTNTTVDPEAENVFPWFEVWLSHGRICSVSLHGPNQGGSDIWSVCTTPQIFSGPQNASTCRRKRLQAVCIPYCGGKARRSSLSTFPVVFLNSYFENLASVVLFGRGTERSKLNESIWFLFYRKLIVSKHWKLNQQVDCDSLNASKNGFRFFLQPMRGGWYPPLWSKRCLETEKRSPRRHLRAERVFG